jgi:hypothetical protein
MKNTKTTKKTTPAAGKSEVVVASSTSPVKRKVGRPKKTESTQETIQVRILTEKEFAAKGVDVYQDNQHYDWNRNMFYLCGKTLTIPRSKIIAGNFKVPNENPETLIKFWNVSPQHYIVEGETGFELSPVAEESSTIITIEVPEGCVIDTENSTATKLVFKKVEVQEKKPKALPKTWEEIERIKGWFVTGDSKLGEVSVLPTYDARNTFETKEQALASIALAQLSILRDIYRQGWVPDWTDHSYEKFSITPINDDYKIYPRWYDNHFLSFQSQEIAEEFLENFRDLIEQARPLMS